MFWRIWCYVAHFSRTCEKSWIVSVAVIVDHLCGMSVIFGLPYPSSLYIVFRITKYFYCSSLFIYTYLPTYLYLRTSSFVFKFLIVKPIVRGQLSSFKYILISSPLIVCEAVNQLECSGTNDYQKQTLLFDIIRYFLRTLASLLLVYFSLWNSISK